MSRVDQCELGQTPAPCVPAQDEQVYCIYNGWIKRHQSTQTFRSDNVSFLPVLDLKVIECCDTKYIISIHFKSQLVEDLTGISANLPFLYSISALYMDLYMYITVGYFILRCARMLPSVTCAIHTVPFRNSSQDIPNRK